MVYRWRQQTGYFEKLAHSIQGLQTINGRSGIWTHTTIPVIFPLVLFPLCYLSKGKNTADIWQIIGKFLHCATTWCDMFVCLLTCLYFLYWDLKENPGKTMRVSPGHQPFKFPQYICNLFWWGHCFLFKLGLLKLHCCFVFRLYALYKSMWFNFQSK